MHCPRCGYPMYCGCSACISKIPAGYKPSTIRDECIEGCGQCGFAMPMQWWEDLDYDIWLRYRDRGDADQIIDNDKTWREYQERIGTDAYT